MSSGAGTTTREKPPRRARMPSRGSAVVNWLAGRNATASVRHPSAQMRRTLQRPRGGARLGMGGNPVAAGFAGAMVAHSIDITCTGSKNPHKDLGTGSGRHRFHNIVHNLSGTENLHKSVLAFALRLDVLRRARRCSPSSVRRALLVPRGPFELRRVPGERGSERVCDPNKPGACWLQLAPDSSRSHGHAKVLGEPRRLTPRSGTPLPHGRRNARAPYACSKRVRGHGAVCATGTRPEKGDTS